MNVFRASQAPYALVLFVSIMTWLFSNALTESKNTLFLSYTEQVTLQSDGPVMQLTLSNDSVQLPLKNASFSIGCLEGARCLRQVDKSFGFVTPLEPTIEPSSVTGDAAGLQVTGLSLLAGSSVRIEFYPAPNAVPPRLFYIVPDDVSMSPVISDHGTSLAWFARNYLAILIWLSVGGIIVLLGWATIEALLSRADSTKDSACACETSEKEGGGFL